MTSISLLFHASSSCTFHSSSTVRGSVKYYAVDPWCVVFPFWDWFSQQSSPINPRPASLISCQSIEIHSAIAICAWQSPVFWFGASDSSTVRSCQKTKFIIKNSFDKKAKIVWRFGYVRRDWNTVLFPNKTLIQNGVKWSNLKYTDLIWKFILVFIPDLSRTTVQSKSL